MVLCKYCINAIKARGEKVWVGGEVEREMDVDDNGKWFISDNLKCDWCDENDDNLYDCKGE